MDAEAEIAGVSQQALNNVVCDDRVKCDRTTTRATGWEALARKGTKDKWLVGFVVIR